MVMQISFQQQTIPKQIQKMFLIEIHIIMDCINTIDNSNGSPVNNNIKNLSLKSPYLSLSLIV